MAFSSYHRADHRDMKQRKTVTVSNASILSSNGDIIVSGTGRKNSKEMCFYSIKWIKNVVKDNLFQYNIIYYNI